MKKITLLYITFLAIQLSSCRQGSTNDVYDIPTLSTENVIMSPGETRRITVLNADKITVRPSSEIVATTVSGMDIDITARSPGNTSIHVTADRTALKCSVTVIDQSAATDGENAPQLFDNTCRFESKDLILRYSTPGTIVATEETTVTFRSLNTGDHIVSTPETLTINDRIIESTRTIEKTVCDTVWYSHTVDRKSTRLNSSHSW